MENSRSLNPCLNVVVLSLACIFQFGCGRMHAVEANPTTSPEKTDTQESPILTGLLPREGFFSGETLAAANLAAIVANVEAGGVLIVSEQHGNQKHYEHQKLALAALQKTGQCTVSVGLEFLAWNHQDAITKYFTGTINESEFLKSTEWGSHSFADYRDQALFPKTTGGTLIGINALRSLTSAISKKGLSGLTPEQQRLMPPNFELGSAAYRERFDIVMGGHVPAEAVDRYFAAQSAWDETMASTAHAFLTQNPTSCLVIIVGDFHAAWGGGLPSRLRARGISNVTVLSQVETRDLTEAELSAELGPHRKYGSRSDAIWLSLAPPEIEPPPSGMARLRMLNLFQ